MPSLEAVVGIIQNQQSLKNCSTQVTRSGDSGLPGNDRLPT